MADNRLTALPEGLSQLKALEFLNLSCNELTKIPDFLYDMQELRVLNLHGNPLRATEVEALRESLPNCHILFEENTMSKPGNSLTEQSARKINPPIEELRPEPEMRQHNIREGEQTAIKFESGAMLYIPADALIDDEGKPFYGMATIYLEEYYNPIDIFLSGVPMQYDSAGTAHTLHSAGGFAKAASTKPSSGSSGGFLYAHQAGRALRFVPVGGRSGQLEF